MSTTLPSAPLAATSPASWATERPACKLTRSGARAGASQALGNGLSQARFTQIVGAGSGNGAGLSPLAEAFAQVLAVAQSAGLDLSRLGMAQAKGAPEPGDAG